MKEIKPDNQKAVFIGLTNIASQIGDLKEGFGKLGVPTFSAIKSYHTQIVDKNVDVVIEDQIKNLFKGFDRLPIGLLKKIARRYYLDQLRKSVFKNNDILLFLWSSFADDYSDYKYWKKAGKRIVTLFVGDDIRWESAMAQEFSEYNLPPIEYSHPSNYNELNVKLRYLRTVEKYSDVVLSLPNQTQLGLRPYHHIKVPLTLSQFKENPDQREIPLVVHAPSVIAGKGTKYIIEAVERLRSEGVRFDFKLLTNIPYNEMKEELATADILVGQMLTPGGGKQEREALACGCVVLSSMRYFYPQGIAADCPVIDAGPENIYKALKQIVLDYELRQNLAKVARNWVERNHDTQKVCSDILKKLETNSHEQQFDFYPDFFRKRFIPESEEAINIYNKWTTFVKDTPWYNKYVPSGQRDGLHF